LNTVPPVVVGVDGGATRTRFVLADADGQTLAECEGGPGLLGAGADQDVADRIVERTREMVREAGKHLPVEVACVGLAGVAGRPEARAFARDHIMDQGVARQVLVVADYEIAFRDAFDQGDGILMIAGTGSVAVGQIGAGPPVRVGGWGALLGDEGSGYRIGLGGIRVAVRGAEGRNSPTRLTDRLFRALAADSVDEVFEWSKRATKRDVAALAPLVIEEADRGDAAAGEIVARAVDGLIQHAEALTNAAGTQPPPEIALVGGLVEPGGLLRQRTLDALERAGFRARAGRVLPTRGAVLMALDSARA
jgi:N-acetylglucosamine kinase-like BadF-type ATPase